MEIVSPTTLRSFLQGLRVLNFFAQDLTTFGPLMQCPYIFPPPVLVGPVLRYLRSMKQAWTIAVLDSYPRKYWWPLLHHYAKKALKMASTGDGDVLLILSSGLDPTPRNSERSLGILDCLLNVHHFMNLG